MTPRGLKVKSPPGSAKLGPQPKETGLAVLACIVTATPGSAWLEHRAADNSVLIHLLDLKSDQEWITTFKDRYETLLLEIFQ